MVTFPPTTTVVNLNGNYIHASQINGLVQCMGEVTSTLKELSLGHTLDGDDNLQLFFSLLRDMPQLKKLDISDCRLTYRSGKYIAQVLRFFPALEDLNVSANLLDVEGANDVSVSLEWMKHLKNLNISAAHIGNCGAVSIVTGLLRSTSPVEVLDLSHNDITDVGVREVCTCLSRLTSPKLYYLNLSHNPFAGLSATQLKSMMAERQTNCVVDATDTPLEEVSRESSKGRQTPDTSET
ncbi:hypothetical protein AGDE_03343 [Angomonas deanei]|nr:hypothetical protein AGDE_03343 [Angomonas deanei]|eukprot:EPY40585.1 hypothetical protein AGDE_03343 [Angomonas deanei]